MTVENKLPKILDIITKWKLNKVVLAAKMGMPTTTFKNKLNPNQTAYRLTGEETERLIDVLKELGADIKNELSFKTKKA